MHKFLGWLLSCGLLVVHGQHASAALVFELREGAELSALRTTNNLLYNQVRQGFTDAANIWSSVLSDNVTINVEINYASLGATVLGQASSPAGNYSFESFRNSLAADAISPDDFQGLANIPSQQVNMRTTNRAGTAFFDNNGSVNNSVIRLTNANAKALGLISANATATDATLTFSSDFGFDFDRSNGISNNLFDFVGVAAHEIGHALGFISGVDVVDRLSAPNGDLRDFDLNGAAPGIGSIDDVAFLNSLDLYRYSAESLALAPNLIDAAVGGNPYFSLDGGVTNLAGFSTGQFNGNGRQASHWLDGQGLGLMDPTLAPGQIRNLTELDIRGFDVIGWNLVAIPEPSIFGCLSLFVTTLALRRSRAQKYSVS